MAIIAEKMDAVILCGGLGTRLRPLTADCPKPMVAIQGKPFLKILIDYVAAFGFRRFVLCAGYKADVIKNYFKNDSNLMIVFSEEVQPLGTAGALKFCEPLLVSDEVLVLNGDSICHLHFPSFLKFHQRHAGMASMAVVPAGVNSEGGFVQLADDNRVIRFVTQKEPNEFSYLSTGIYILKRKVIQEIPIEQNLSLENDVFPALLSSGVYGFVTSEALYDIGTPEKLEFFSQKYMAIKEKLARV